MHFIGSNDESTLRGVAEHLRSVAKGHTYYATHSSRKAERERHAFVAHILEEEAWYCETAAKNGPPPDLSKLRIVIPEESRKRLMEDAAASDTSERSE